jgi:branched-chain amino acid transport system substrate-binding protein
MDDSANVVGETKSEVGSSDFSTYISQIQASEADWVFTALAGGDTVNFLKQADSFGLQSEVNVVGPLNAYQSVREGAGSAAADTYSVVSYYEGRDNERNQDFVSNFSDIHDLPPDNSAEVAYTDLQMYAKAVMQAGTTTTDDVIEALVDVEYQAPMGTASYRECDHQARRSLYFGRITDQSQYDWPGIELLDDKPGEEVMTPCSETNCSF